MESQKYNNFLEALNKINIDQIPSSYTTALLKHKDPKFIKYLYFVIGDDDCDDYDEFIKNPNSEDNLEYISSIGFNYYNTFILGN